MWGFKRKQEQSFRGVPVDIGGQWFDQEVVGESKYQPVLRRVEEKADRSAEGMSVFDAYLIAEPKNRFDRNAVMVCHPDFGCFGYLPRRDAARISGKLQQMQQRGEVAQCRGKLVGGAPGMHLGVYLNANLEKLG